MKKIGLMPILMTMLLSVTAFDAFADEFLSVSGRIVNSLSKEPVGETIDITLFGENGEPVNSTWSRQEYRLCQFSTIVPSRGKYRLRFTSENYDTAYVDFEYPKSRNFFSVGTVAMRKLTKAEKGVKLGEITVTATKLKFYNKGDTVVYNADAFELSSGSMLDELVSQLPGAELRDDGRIYVNGRFVDNLLLNGRDFFRGDNKVMLENLPTYMVKNVQVYEKMSERSRLAGMKMDDGTYVMDIQLKKDHQTGWLANAEAGGGTKERYMGRAFGLRFTPPSRVSVFGNVNNINDTRKPGRNGDWSPADLTNGLATTKNGGIDYGLFNKENTYEVNGNVTASYIDGIRDSYTDTQNFLSSGDTYSSSWNDSKNHNLSLTTSHDLRFNLDDEIYGGSRITGRLFAGYMKNDSRLGNVGALFSDKPADSGSLRDSIEQDRMSTMPWVNSSVNRSKTKSENMNVGGNVALYYSMPYRNDGFEVKSSGNYSRSTADNREENMIRFRDYGPQMLNRLNKSPNNDYSYSLGANYIFAPNMKLRINPIYNFKKSYRNSTSDWYDFEEILTHKKNSIMLPSVSRAFSETVDAANSYNMGVHTYEHEFAMEIMKYFSYLPEGANWDRSFSIRMGLYATYRTDKISFNGSQRIGRNRHTWLPNPYIWLSYSHSGQNQFDLVYNMFSTAPNALNLIDVEFTSDPLNIRIGNPNLRDTYQHKFKFNYYAQKWATERGMNLYVNLEYSVWKDELSMGYTYNPALGIRRYRPQNIDGNWWGWGALGFRFPITRDRKLTINTYTRADFNDNADMVDVEGQSFSSKRVVHNTQFMENVNIDYSIGKSKIGAMGRVHTRHSTSSAVNFRTINAVEFRYGLTGLVKLPLDIEISTDITMFSRRGYSNPSMNTDDLVWNASMSKGVMNNNLTFTLEAFDILHNLSNIRYELNGMGRTETWVNCIPRYLMFKARYRLNIQPRKRN